jgi:hypothetical protein
MVFMMISDVVQTIADAIANLAAIVPDDPLHDPVPRQTSALPRLQR